MGRGLISPPRSMFSPKPLPPRPPTNPNKPPSHRKESRPSALRATKNTHTSSSSLSSSSSNHPNKKKLESNNNISSPKSDAKTSGHKSPSSPINHSSKSNTKEAIGSASNGKGHQQHVAKAGNDLNHSLSAQAQSGVRDLLHHLSIEGKEEECSSQSNANNNNGTRIYEIYKEIASHRQGNSPITSYFTKLKALWDELAAYIDMPQFSPRSIDIKLAEHIEREKVVQFLVGLHESYSTICSQILLMSPFPTLEEAFVVIIREETRRELLSSLESIAANVNNWVPTIANNSNNNDIIEQIGDNLSEQEVDQNEASPLPIEPVQC